MMDKKAMYENWPEFIATVVLVIGFIISLSLHSAFMSYVTILLCGGMFGRFWYGLDNEKKFSWLIVITGFLIGFLLGEYYASKRAIILLFVIGVVISHYLHAKGYVKTVTY